MSQMNEDKRPKEQRSLFRNKAQAKKVLAQKNKGNSYKNRIQILLLKAILLFFILLDSKTNINKINLKTYKEIKLVSSLRTVFYELISDKDFIY